MGKSPGGRTCRAAPADEGWKIPSRDLGRLADRRGHRVGSRVSIAAVDSRAVGRRACRAGGCRRPVNGNGGADSGKNGTEPWLRKMWRMPPKENAGLAHDMERALKARCRELDGDAVAGSSREARRMRPLA
ncbi:MAG: hypothetical protein OXC66_03290 [Roseovarius sp.]|nr:hypothetical protein [Roseovarius sp.]